MLLKANATTTALAWDGGTNGYIGLIITPAAYDIIAPGTPFIRPPAPPIQPTMPVTAINNNNTGFANITLQAMLDFLFQAYSWITPLQLEANDEEMQKCWDPNMLIETLIQQIEKGQVLPADGNKPFTKGKIVTMVFNNVFRAADFQEACCHWKHRPTIEKTRENFKTQFIEAQMEIQKE
jgi:hypothetical protein